MKDMSGMAGILVCTFILFTSVDAVWSKGPHNFTDGEGNDEWFTGKVSCSACHTPVGEVHPEPLWDPEYENTVLPVFNTDMLEEKDGIPYGPTKLCVSCHDDTVAKDMSIVYEGSQEGNHTVGVVYDEFMAAKNPRLKSPNGIGLPLYDGRLECTTCHDPHSDEPGMLRVSTSRSELCFRCHEA